MNPTRRDMLRSGAAAAAAVLTPWVSGAPHRYFTPHPFIDRNPKAVFIRRTHVAHKMDARRSGMKDCSWRE